MCFRAAPRALALALALDTYSFCKSINIVASTLTPMSKIHQVRESNAVLNYCVGEVDCLHIVIGQGGEGREREEREEGSKRSKGTEGRKQEAS